MKFQLLYFLVLFFITSCNPGETETVQGNWIRGTEEEKLKIIEKQFRGFDMAMVETAYRYQELYWAGQDENWEYANYQLGKMRIVLENGLQRRPKRAVSAEYFLSEVLPGMQKAIDTKEPEMFNVSFNSLTTNCNNCHAKENVPFFTVKTPTERQSPIRK